MGMGMDSTVGLSYLGWARILRLWPELGLGMTKVLGALVACVCYIIYIVNIFSQHQYTGVIASNFSESEILSMHIVLDTS